MERGKGATDFARRLRKMVYDILGPPGHGFSDTLRNVQGLIDAFYYWLRTRRSAAVSGCDTAPTTMIFFS